MDFRPYVQVVADFPTFGETFWDLGPLLADPAAFRAAVAALAEPVRTLEPTHVLGLESRGFIFGAALAETLGLGFVAARRPGKLPPPLFRETWGSVGEALEIQQQALQPKDRVLIVDDVLATGATAAAARGLVLACGAQPLALTCFLEMGTLPGRDKLAGMPVFSMMRA